MMILLLLLLVFFSSPAFAQAGSFPGGVISGGGSSASTTGTFVRLIPPDANTVAYWKFDEAVGTTVFPNSIGGGTSMTKSAGTGTFVAGNIGVFKYAADFGQVTPGQTVVLQSTTTPQPASFLTLSAWVRLESSSISTSTNQLVIQNNLAGMYFDGSYKFSCYATTSVSGQVFAITNLVVYPNATFFAGIVVGTSVQSTLWHFVACTYDGVKVRAYFDGQDVASVAATGTLTWAAATSWSIGNNDPVGLASRFPGAIDDVRIEDVARSATYLETQWRAGVNWPDPSP
jgi:hypothetical protein